MPSAYFNGDKRRGRQLLLRRAGLIDPAGGGDFVGDVLVAGGEIVAARRVVDGVPGGCVVVDAAGLVGCPGFKETIATGALAGVQGGFATRCCMPNAARPIDSESVNEGIEVSSAPAYGGRSVIEERVTAGVAVRMAVLYQLNAGERE